MAITLKPDMRPANPNFSSGPCAKRPGFTLVRCLVRCWGAATAPANPRPALPK